MNKLYLRALLVAMCLLMTGLPRALAVTEVDIVTSFKKLAAEQMPKALATYEGMEGPRYFAPDKTSSICQKGCWQRRVKVLDSNYKIDVKRTDSLISPYSATLETEIREELSGFEPSKEAATNAPNADYLKNLNCNCKLNTLVKWQQP